MGPDTKILQIMPVQNIYVKLLYTGRFYDGDNNEDGEIPLRNSEGAYDERRFEVKPVICLALTQDMDQEGVHPMVFDENYRCIDFAAQSDVLIEDLYYRSLEVTTNIPDCRTIDFIEKYCKSKTDTK